MQCGVTRLRDDRNAGIRMVRDDHQKERIWQASLNDPLSSILYSLSSLLHRLPPRPPPPSRFESFRLLVVVGFPPSQTAGFVVPAAGLILVPLLPFGHRHEEPVEGITAVA